MGGPTYLEPEGVGGLSFATGAPANASLEFTSAYDSEISTPSGITLSSPKSEADNKCVKITPELSHAGRRVRHWSPPTTQFC